MSNQNPLEAFLALRVEHVKQENELLREILNGSGEKEETKEEKIDQSPIKGKKKKKKRPRDPNTPKKVSGYNLFVRSWKAEHPVGNHVDENGEKIRWMSLAASAWKKMTTPEKNVWIHKANTTNADEAERLKALVAHEATEKTTGTNMTSPIIVGKKRKRSIDDDIFESSQDQSQSLSQSSISVSIESESAKKKKKKKKKNKKHRHSEG